MTCALGRARPWTGPRDPGPGPFLITLLAGAEFKFWDSCAQNKSSEISSKATFRNSGTPVRRITHGTSQKHALSQIMGLLCAEQNVGNLNKNALSECMGLLCAEQNVGNLRSMHFQKFWDSCAQNRKSEVSKNVNFNKAHVLALNKANTKEVAEEGRLRKGGAAFGRPPLCGFLCVGCEHWAYFSVET